jgi:hypothetical protein
MAEQRHDLISRQALMEEYDRVHIGPPGGARKLMMDAPTVDAEEVVHGEWIDSYSIHNGKTHDSIDCSACEEVFKIESHDREYWKRRFKRCFCCGAVMDGGCDGNTGSA